MFFHGSGIIIMTASGSGIPFITRNSSVLSSIAESEPDAVMTGVETRSSSPVRLPRSAQRMSNILGLYPVGEGAGYAGGIVSAAVDGIETALTALEGGTI